MSAAMKTAKVPPVTLPGDDFDDFDDFDEADGWLTDPGLTGRLRDAATTGMFMASAMLLMRASVTTTVGFAVFAALLFAAFDIGGEWWEHRRDPHSLPARDQADKTGEVHRQDQDQDQDQDDDAGISGWLT